MVDPYLKFRLYCDATNGFFVLESPDGGFNEAFTSLDAALAFAGSIATAETGISVFNEVGELILKTTISPSLLNRDEPNS